MLGLLLYYLAIKKIHLVDATALAYTGPFFTPFIWKIWRKEKIEKDVWWSIILGFIGILLILKPGIEIINPGAILGLLSGIFSAIALVGLRRLDQKEESLFLTLQYLFTISTLMLLPYAFYNWQTPNVFEWYIILSIGVATFIAQILLTIAYRHGTASFLSPLSYSMIFFIGLSSWLIFYQIPDDLSILGSILIIIGGSLTYSIRKKAKSLTDILEAEKEPWWKKLFHKRKD